MPLIETIAGPTEGGQFNARSFLEYLRKSAEHWWPNPQESASPWVFRGHWDANWKLQPTAGRDSIASLRGFAKLVNQSKREVDESENWKKLSPNAQEVLARKWAHFICLRSFLRLADELNFGVSMTDDYCFQEICGYHNFSELIDRLGRSAERGVVITHPNSHKGYNTTALALAQHHRIPTFLLDWTENPLAACYFATTKPDQIDAKDGLAVWALDSSALPLDSFTTGDRSYLQMQMCNPLKTQNTFLSTQSGVFLESRNFETTWIETGAFPDLETFVSRFEPSVARNAIQEYSRHDSANGANMLRRYDDWSSARVTILKKIVLATSELPELRRLLIREGVTKAHMMPTLDNIASTAMTSLTYELEL